MPFVTACRVKHFDKDIVFSEWHVFTYHPKRFVILYTTLEALNYKKNYSFHQKKAEKGS